MATNTTRWGLRKPAAGDTINPATDLGGPYDTIDAALGSTVCTSGTRPGTPVVGQIIFETDTERTYIWAGSGAGGWLPVAPLTAVKTTDKTVTSSTTLTDDTQLVLPVAANTTYLLQAFLIYSGALAADAKMGLTVPSGATWKLAPFALTSAASATSGSTEEGVFTASGITLGIGAATPTQQAALVTGSLVVGGTAGTCAVSFAQLVSSATASVLATGSTLQLTRV